MRLKPRRYWPGQCGEDDGIGDCDYAIAEGSAASAHRAKQCRRAVSSQRCSGYHAIDDHLPDVSRSCKPAVIGAASCTCACPELCSTHFFPNSTPSYVHQPRRARRSANHQHILRNNAFYSKKCHCLRMDGALHAELVCLLTTC